MPNRYWVSGSGTWNSTNTANWSDTSGGAGGASVPTADDDVFFDGNSDLGAAFTVTIGTGAVCKTFDANTGTPLDQTMTLAGTGALDIHGSFLLPSSNFTRTYTGTITFIATTTGHTVTTNGVTFASRFAFDGVGGEWKLGSSLTITGGFSAPLLVRNGTFDTDGYGITLSNLQFSSPSIIYLRNSTVTLAGSAGSLQRGFRSSTDINGSNATLALTNGNCTVTYVGTLGTITHTATSTTYYDEIFVGTFDIVTRTSDGVSFIYFEGNPTITTELKVNSGNTNPVRRVFFVSGSSSGLTPGEQRTITAAAIDFGSGIDFSDIVAAGAASPFDVSALQGGDCKNNSNITFPAAKTVYRIGTGNFSATQWASSSGGSPAADQFPLAQDTMVFDANTTTGTHTINANYQLGTLDMTDSTTVTLASGGSSNTSTFYGDMTLSNAVIPSGIGAMTFSGRNTQTITSSGRTFIQPLQIDSPSGTVVLADALVSNNSLALTRGTLDLNNQTAACSVFSSSNSNTRSIAFGTGKIVCTNSGFRPWDCNNSTNLNITYTNDPRVEYAYSGSDSTSFSHGVTGGTESNAVSLYVTAGNYAFSIGAGNEKVRNLDFTGFSGSLNSNIARTLFIYKNLVVPSGVTFTEGPFNFAGSSGIQTVTTNGVTLDLPITKSGAGTLQLQDNLTQGSTRIFTHTAGTVDLNGNTLTVGSNYSTSNSNVREIAFNGGTLDCTGNFTATTGTNLTTSGTGTIKMSSGSAKTFAGGGRTYPVLEQAGAGTLTITGANKFYSIGNSYQPATIVFPANTTTKVTNFTVRGTPGNLMTLQSSSAGTRFTLEYEA
jgi:hypothetical protein